jgi:hypothetical protein
MLMQPRDAFQKHGLVLSPSCSWHCPSQCVQNCPPDMLSKIGVLPVPSAWNATRADCAQVTQFFEKTLGIKRTCALDEFLQEIDFIRSHPAFASLSRMRHLYQLINETVPNLPPPSWDVDKLRQVSSVPIDVPC